MVVAEESEYGVLLRPAAVLPVEIYSPERKAEFLVANATDSADREKAEEEVRRMGVRLSKARKKSKR